MRQRDGQKEAQLFAATLRLVARVGIAGLTVPLIAKEAGIGTGTVYVYFKGKEALITALFKDVKNRFQTSLFKGHQAGKPVKESLRLLWDNGLRYMAARYEEQVFIQQFNVSPYRQEEENVEYALRAIAPLLEVLRTGQEQGLVKEDKEHLTLSLFFGFMRQLAEGERQNPLPVSKTMSANTFQYFWDAIKA